VHLVQIDVVELQALQAGLHPVHDVDARQTARIDALCAGLAEHFGRDDDALTRHLEIPERLPGNELRAPFRVDIRGIDEIDACVERAAEEPVSFRLLQVAYFLPDPAAAAEGHRAEAQLRDE
jgi:hypothetical protein